MDAELTGALLSADVDDSQAQTWFDLVDQAYTEAGGGWDTFEQRLTAAAAGEFTDAAQAFLKYVDDHGRLNLVSRLIADIGTLPSAYANMRASGVGFDEVTWDQPTDEDWHEVVAQFSKGFAGWDGTEPHWAQLCEWLYRTANGQNRRWYAAAYQHLNPLTGVAASERAAALRRDGFQIPATLLAKPADEPRLLAAPTTTADPAPGDTAWYQVVAQFSKAWADWDGTDAHWSALLTWVYSTTNSQNPQWYAAAHQHLNPLTGTSAEHRAAQLREWGFEVNSKVGKKKEQPTLAPPSATAVPDPRAWDAVVTQYGGGMAGWDGTDAHWAALLDWLYRSTQSQNEDWYAATYQHFNRLTNATTAERVKRLREWHFTVTPNTGKPPATQEPAPEGESGTQPEQPPDPWQAVVAEWGSTWAGWDGSDAQWASYRDRLYNDAYTRNRDWYVAARERLDPLNTTTRADRIARLIALGLTITAPQTPDRGSGRRLFRRQGRN